jgi:hypothetical protein
LFVKNDSCAGTIDKAIKVIWYKNASVMRALYSLHQEKGPGKKKGPGPYGEAVAACVTR